MPTTLLTVATRKGTFLFTSDDRKNWTMSEPLCEGWPIYHAIYDAESGDMYAAAASEWHGATVWRSSDLGETWESSSEGIGFGEGDAAPKLSKISGLTAAHGRLFAGVETPGIFESRDKGKTWSLLSTLDGMPGRSKPPTKRSSTRWRTACGRRKRCRHRF